MPGIKIKIDASDAVKEGKKAENALNGVGKSAKTAEKDVSKFSKALGIDKEVRAMTAGLGKIGSAVFSLKSAFASIGIGLFVRDLYNAKMQMDGFTRAFAAGTGSMTAGASQMKWLRDQANNLGLTFDAVAESYKGILTAATGTELEGKGVQMVFQGIAEAGRAMNLTNEQMSGSLMALQQMLGKGKVSAEELRQQLGERLPGAFRFAAEAMDLTTAGLDKMMSEGKLMATDFLPKFGALMHEKFGQAAKDAAHDAAAEMARFQNAIFDLKVELASGAFIDTVTETLRTLTGYINEHQDDLADMFNAAIEGAKNLPGHIDSIVTALKKYKDELSWFVDNWEVIAGVYFGSKFGPWGAAIGGGLGLVVDQYRDIKEEIKTAADEAERIQALLDKRAQYNQKPAALGASGIIPDFITVSGGDEAVKRVTDETVKAGAAVKKLGEESGKASTATTALSKEQEAAAKAAQHHADKIADVIANIKWETQMLSLSEDEQYRMNALKSAGIGINDKMAASVLKSADAYLKAKADMEQSEEVDWFILEGKEAALKAQEANLRSMEEYNEEFSKNTSETADKVATAWEEAAKNIQTALAGLFKGISTGAFESPREMIAGIAEVGGSAWTETFAATVMDGFKDSTFIDGIAKSIGGVFESDEAKDAVKVAMLGTFSNAISAVVSGNKGTMIGTGIGTLVGTVIGAAVSKGAGAMQGAAIGSSVGGGIGSMFESAPSYGEQLGKAMDALAEKTDLNTTATQILTKEMLAGKDYSSAGLIEKYFNPKLLTESVFGDRSLMENLALPLIEVLENGMLSIRADFTDKGTRNQELIYKAFDSSGLGDTVTRKIDLGGDYGRRNANADEINTMFTSLFDAAAKEGIGGLVRVVNALNSLTSTGDVTLLFDELAKLPEYSAIGAENIRELFRAFEPEYESGAKLKRNTKNPTENVIADVWATIENEVTSSFLSLIPTLEGLGEQYDVALAGAFIDTDGVLQQLFNTAFTAKDKAIKSVDDTFEDVKTEVDNLKALSASGLINLDPKIQAFIDNFDGAIDQIKTGVEEFYAAARAETLSDMAKDIAIATGTMSQMEQAYASINEKAESYRKELIDNGMALDEAATKAGEWARQVKVSEYDKKFQADRISYEDRIMELQGKSSELLAIQRQRELDAINLLYGAGTDGAVAIGNLANEVFRLEDAAKIKGYVDQAAVIVAKDGLSDLDSALYDINTKWQPIIDHMIELGASTDDLNTVYAAQEIEIKNVKDGIEDMTLSLEEFNQTVSNTLLSLNNALGIDFDPSLFLESIGLSGSGLEDLLSADSVSGFMDDFERASELLKAGEITQEQYNSITGQLINSASDWNSALEASKQAIEEEAAARRAVNQESGEWRKNIMDQYDVDNSGLSELEQAFKDVETEMEDLRQAAEDAGCSISVYWKAGGVVETEVKNQIRQWYLSNARNEIDTALTTQGQSATEAALAAIAEQIKIWSDAITESGYSPDQLSEMISAKETSMADYIDRINSKYDLAISTSRHSDDPAWVEKMERQRLEEIEKYTQTVYDSIEALKLLGYTEEDLAKIREWEAAEIQKLKDAYTQPLEETVATAGMSDLEKQLRELNKWYEDQAKEAEALGESLDLLNAAYDAQIDAIKKQYTDNWSDIAVTSGMSELEKQLYELNKWYEEQSEAAALLGLSLDDLTSAMEAQLDVIKKQYIDNWSDIVETSGMSDIEKQIYELNKWYEDQAAAAALLGLSLEDLNEAYEKQLEAIMEAIAAKEDELGIQILRAQGNEEAAIAKEREMAMADLIKAYGDEGDAIYALQEELWLLDDIAREAARALEITNKEMDLQLQILNALGDEEGALALQREIQMAALMKEYGEASGPLAELLLQLWELEDAASEAARAAEISNKETDLMIQALRLQGNEEAAVALEREMAMQALIDAYGDEGGAIYNLQQAIWDMEDAAAQAAKELEIANKETDLRIQILRTQGLEEAAIALEREMVMADLIKTYGDEGSAIYALQEELWYMEDAAKAAADALEIANKETELRIQILRAQGNEEAALILEREMAMASLIAAYGEEGKAIYDLQEELWLVEDLAKAAAAALEILNKENELQIQILRAKGSEEAALALEREIAMAELIATFGDAGGAIYALQEELWKLEDAARAAEKVESARTDLMDAIQRKITELEEQQQALEDEYNKQKDAYVTRLQELIDAENEAYQEQIDAQNELLDAARDLADGFGGVIDQIKQYRDDLMTSDDLIGIETRYKTSRAQLDAAVKDMYSSDKNVALAAMEKIPDLSQTFLDLSKGVNATATGYNQDLAKVMALLNTTEGMAGVYQSAEERTVSALESQIKIMEDHTSIYQAMLDEIENADKDTRTLAEIQKAYYDSKTAFDTSTLQTEIDYWTQELEKLDALANVMLSIEDALAAYNAALIAAEQPPAVITRDPIPPPASYQPPDEGLDHVSPLSFSSDIYTPQVRTNGPEMKEVAEVLKEVKGVLIQIRDTNGDMNLNGKKVHRILDRVTQGETYIRTQAVA